MLDLDDDEIIAVDMAPLIDCVFLLLIFFLVASTLKKLEPLVPLELPGAVSAVREAVPSDQLVVAIDRVGRIYVDSKPVTTNGLIERVKASLAEHPDRPVRIDADRETAYRHLMQVIDELRFHGCERIGLHTLDHDHARRLKPAAP